MQALKRAKAWVGRNWARAQLTWALHAGWDSHQGPDPSLGELSLPQFSLSLETEGEGEPGAEGVCVSPRRSRPQMLTCMTVVCIGISHQELAISHVQSLLLCILNSGTGIDADCPPPSDTPDPTALSPQALNDLLIGSSSVLSPAPGHG